MIELFVEFMWQGEAHQERVMFCTSVDQLESTAGSDCEPFSFNALEECEEAAVWYGTIATANSFRFAPRKFIGPQDNQHEMMGPLQFLCVSKGVA